jgi:hypothetical protein
MIGDRALLGKIREVLDGPADKARFIRPSIW